MMSMIVFLSLLQVKHWLVDFVWQTNEMVQYKGVYGHPTGIIHSAFHGIGTGVCLLAVALTFGVAAGLALGVVLALADAVTHYHIDWAKMNFGNRDIYNPKFWNHLGLDQMAHQLIYLAITVILFS